MGSVGETFHFSKAEAHTSDLDVAVPIAAETPIDTAPETSAETAVAAPPQETAPLSDEDIFALMMDKNEAERQENIQNNTERLTSYYGDQQFKYGTHSGTITTILNVCPPIKGLLANANGFDAIADWIDPHKVVEEEKAEKDKDTAQDDTEEGALKNTHADKRDEATVDKKTDEMQATETKSEKVNRHAAPKGEKEADRKDTLETPPTPAPQNARNVAEEKHTATKDSHSQEGQTSPITKPSKESSHPPTSSEEESVVEAVSDAAEMKSTLEVEATDEPDTYKIPQEPSISEAVEVVDIIEKEPESDLPATTTILEAALQNEQQQPEANTDEIPAQTTSFEYHEADETEVPVEYTDTQHIPEQNDNASFDAEALILQEDFKSDEQTVRSNKDLSANAAETPAETELEEVPDEPHVERIEHEHTEMPIELPQSELLHTWRKLGEEEAPLDVALTTIIEHVEHVAQQNTSDDETMRPESNEHMPEDADESLVFTGPELRYTLEKVHRARHSIEQLQRATTKEECEQHVAAIIEEITQLLTLLGYETPAKIIQDFLADHSVQSLRELLEYLETILTQAIERDAQSRHSTPQVKHTSLLAKLALQLVQTFAPQQPAPYSERLSS